MLRQETWSFPKWPRRFDSLVMKTKLTNKTNYTEYATESGRETSMRHANSLLLDGSFAAAAKTEHATESGRETSVNFESRNPATGELLGTYPEHNKAEIEVRLQRAWNGWRRWSRTPLQERIAFLTW